MFEVINNWIKNGCNYQEGIGLYEKYGDNAAYKSLFKVAETAFNAKKLNALLVEIRNASVPEIKPVIDQPATPPVAPAPAPPPADQPTNPAPELFSIIRQRDQTHAELRSLKPHLDILPEGEDLRLLAARLVKLAKANAVLWQRYNYMTETGVDPEAPEPPPEPVMIDLHLLQERERIRKSLNKAINRIKGVEKPKPKTLELIVQQRQALKDLDAKIARIKAGGKS